MLGFKLVLGWLMMVVLLGGPYAVLCYFAWPFHLAYHALYWVIALTYLGYGFITEVNISGMVVPSDTTVAPMMTLLIPSRLARRTAASTVQSAPNTSRAMPPTVSSHSTAPCRAPSQTANQPGSLVAR